MSQGSGEKKDRGSIEPATRRVYTVRMGNKTRSFFTRKAAVWCWCWWRAAVLDGQCQCSNGDYITLGEYCGCRERRLKIATRLHAVFRRAIKNRKLAKEAARLAAKE